MSRGGKLPTRFEGPERSPGFLLWQLSMSWQRKQRAALEPLELTHVQFVLLASAAWLDRDGEPVAQVDIAAHARTDVMMTSQVLRALEERGLVRREAHPEDSRAKRITVTPAGRALVVRAIKVVEDVDEAFFASLGPKREAFIDAMQALIAGNEGA